MARPETKFHAPGLYRVEHSLGDVEIGRPNDFKPRAKMNRWGGECFIDVSYPTSKSKAAIHADNKVKWQDDDVDVVMYPTSEDDFEFEVILKSRPATNFILLDIDSQGLDFFYQAKLTLAELAEGFQQRPDNIIGSYAVYHKTKRKFFQTVDDGAKYKCGKAFHIYRPELIDANGDRMWAEMNITGAQLRITMDDAWLDSAVYPVIVDPTFGYTTAAATPWFMSTRLAGRAVAYQYTASAGDTLVTLHSYSFHTLGDPSYIWDLAVYDMSGGVPDNRLGNAVQMSCNGAMAWYTTAITDVMSNGSTYVVAAGNDQPGNASAYFDSLGANSYSNYGSDGALPATWSESAGSVAALSIYATYTEGGGDGDGAILLSSDF